MSTQHTVSHLYELPFKIRTKETNMSPKAMMCGLCSVLNPDRESLRIHGWSPLPQLQGQGRAGFYEHKEDLFAYLPAITDSVVEPGQKAVLRVDIRHHTH